VDKIISSKHVSAAAVVFFYRLTQDQHFAMVPVHYTHSKQLNLAFPVDFDIIYIY